MAAEAAQFANRASLMNSFSAPNRFSWCNMEFVVEVPNGSLTAYHPRATPTELKELLYQERRVTAAGNLGRSEKTHDNKPYDFYLAQLIHYGLEFHFDMENAQRALEVALRMDTLEVPSRLGKLKRELKKVYKEYLKEAGEGAAKKQEPAKNWNVSKLVDHAEETSQDEGEEVSHGGDWETEVQERTVTGLSDDEGGSYEESSSSKEESADDLDQYDAHDPNGLFWDSQTNPRRDASHQQLAEVDQYGWGIPDPTQRKVLPQQPTNAFKSNWDMPAAPQVSYAGNSSDWTVYSTAPRSQATYNQEHNSQSSMGGLYPSAINQRQHYPSEPSSSYGSRPDGTIIYGNDPLMTPQAFSHVHIPKAPPSRGRPSATPVRDSLNTLSLRRESTVPGTPLTFINAGPGFGGKDKERQKPKDKKQNRRKGHQQPQVEEDIETSAWL